MKYQRFEDLPVWQTAMDFAVHADALSQDRAFNGHGDARDQLQRAALSISNNIAEGFERGTTPERLSYIYIARGSAGESRSILRFCQRVEWLAHRRLEVDLLIAEVESVSRQLYGWADSLQNSDIKGQRHLNDQTRANYDQARRADAFWQKLQEVREGKRKPEDL